MRKLFLVSLVGAFLIPLSPVKAETVDSSDSKLPSYESIKAPVERQLSNLKKTFDSLDKNFLQGVDSLTGEIEAQINQSIESLNLPDMLGMGRKIEEIVANQKADILQLDPRIKGKNAKLEWNQEFTLNQSETVLGEGGQRLAKEKRDNTQKAVEISATSADAAQNDLVTQDIMKKIANQNAQTTRVLQSVQGSLSKQNEISAVANVNLTDISQHLTRQEKRQEDEEQEAVNAIHKNAAFRDKLWSSGNIR